MSAAAPETDDVMPSAAGALDDWVAIDFETASTRGTPCQVGGVRMQAGVEASVFSTLIYQPPDEFDTFNIALHGITPATVKGAPHWPDVREQLLRFSGGAPLVAHNASFDIGVLRDASDICGLAWPPVRYACTLGIARQVWPGLNTYSLRLLCHRLELSAVGRNHDALHDAQLAANLLVRAISERQVHTLIELLEAVNMRLGDLDVDGWHGSTLRQLRARDVLESVSAADADPASPFYGKTVVFTGELAMVRRLAWKLVAEVGGIPAENVTKKTDFLVSGYQDLVKLAQGETKSHKFRRAEELSREGASLEFLTEKDFFELIQTTAHTPPMH